MPLVVGVSFKPAGRVYSFDPNGLGLKVNDQVIIETTRGIELGRIKHSVRDVPEDKIVPPLKRVLRAATDEDRAQAAANEEKAEQALLLCRERVAARGMQMKLMRAEYQFDRSQVTIFFAAEGRVDFRELVKDLAAQLRTRIQLHQVGARDAAKLLG
ncbi:MAG: PSP1 domain-containing protein, partial [Actinomycetota bacterium]